MKKEEGSRKEAVGSPEKIYGSVLGQPKCGCGLRGVAWKMEAERKPTTSGTCKQSWWLLLSSRNERSLALMGLAGLLHPFRGGGG